MTISKQYPIIMGPSKWDLSVALFDRKSINCRKVSFQANAPTAKWFELRVDSVQAEDGSGESWNIEGSATEVSGVKKPSPPSSRVPKPSSRVFIHFRTDQRKGYVRFFD